MRRNYKDDIVSRLESIVKRRKRTEIKDLGSIAYDDSVYPLKAVIVNSQQQDAMNIFLSGGVHGDEPAGVYALLNFLKTEIRNYRDFNFVIVPCINPIGYEMDRRTNGAFIDINRDFRNAPVAMEVLYLKRFLKKCKRNYVFAMDMHENDVNELTEGYRLRENPREFYLYEVSPTKDTSIGNNIIEALKDQGVQVTRRRKIYNEKCSGGLIWSRGRKDRNYSDKHTLEGYIQEYATYAFTTETPTCWSIKKRIDTQLKVLKAALNEARTIRTIEEQEKESEESKGYCKVFNK